METKRCPKCGETKVCTKCGIEKNLEEFSWLRKAEGTRQYWCKACYNEYRHRTYKSKAYWRQEGAFRICGSCGDELVAGENWLAWAVKRGRNLCKYCASAASRKYAREHPEKVAAREREYTRTHKAENHSRQVIYYQVHQEELKAQSREYHQQNREKCLLRMKRWREANPDKMKMAVKRWQKANPEAARASNQRRRARKANTIENLAPDQIKEIKNGGCFFCGSFDALALAHDIAVSKGGNTTRGNVFCLCRSCNSKMGTKSLADMLGQLELI